MNKNRIALQVITLLALLAVPLHAADSVKKKKSVSQENAKKTEPQRKPNIILILSDDVGIGDIGCYGGPYKTPNIDQLAKTGTRFEYSYATPLCGPSRCEVLTGRYPFRTGLNSNHSERFLTSYSDVMLPTIMKKAGYLTACVGKWGQMPYGPGEWGFDEYLSFLGSGVYTAAQRSDYQQNGEWKKLQEGEYLPDIMARFITNFIEKHQEKPFFLYYPMVHIHGPIIATPDSKKDVNKAQLYADNIEYMDKLVGNLVADLDRLKMRENTLIVFSGDNGTAHMGAPAHVNGSQINGMKAQLLEGGSRVPLVVNWPGVTPAGKVNHDLTDFSDFYSTFAKLAGAKLPEGVVIDSHDFSDQIKGGKGTPRDWCYVELNGGSYARDARYKLTNKGELYDLKNAPFEEILVASSAENEESVASRKKLQAVLDQHPASPATESGKKERKKSLKRSRNNEAATPLATPVPSVTTSPTSGNQPQ
jgi:arylsulfatase A